MPFGKATWFIPTLTWQPRRQAERVVARFPAPALVVDLGAGGRKIAPHVKTVDFVKFPGTDYVSDVTATPFDAGTVDLVIATGLLEHVEDDRKLIGEMRRILKTGGTAYIEIPFLQQYHDDPIDCRRLTQPGLALLLKQQGFEVVDSGTHIGPTVTLLTLAAYWLSMWFEGRTCRAQDPVEWRVRRRVGPVLAVQVSRRSPDPEGERASPRLRRLLHGPEDRLRDMTAASRSTPFEPVMIEEIAGPVLAIHHAPRMRRARARGVVYLPPFAEEMNRARRMATLQAQTLAAGGDGALILDPYGSGDSGGEFGDARWETWHNDAARAVSWMHERGYESIVLIGLRLGALLALDAARDPARTSVVSCCGSPSCAASR